MKYRTSKAPMMAVDQNRLDVAELTFCFIICEGVWVPWA